MVLYHEKIIKPTELENLDEIIEDVYNKIPEGYDVISLNKSEDNISIFNTFIKFRDRLVDIKKGFYDWDEFFKETVGLTDDEIKEIKFHILAFGTVTSRAAYRSYVKDDEVLFDNITVGETEIYSKYKLGDKYLFIDHKFVPSYEEYRPSFIVKALGKYHIDISYSVIDHWNSTKDCRCSSVSSLAIIYDNETLEKVKKLIIDSIPSINNFTLNEYEIIRIV